MTHLSGSLSSDISLHAAGQIQHQYDVVTYLYTVLVNLRQVLFCKPGAGSVFYPRNSLLSDKIQAQQLFCTSSGSGLK